MSYIDLNIKNDVGNTPVDCARVFGYGKNIKIIKDFISFRKEFYILLLIFNRKEILPNEMIDMIIKIRKLIEINS